MMNHTAKKDEFFFSKGSVISGKWRNTQYTVVKHLGTGMVGTVYLCHTKGREVALKISDQSMQMATEVHMLKELNEVQDGHLGPLLYEMDDWTSPQGKVYTFYTMEYIASTPINIFIKRKGPIWLIVLLIQFLDELTKVHAAGFVLGDLKMEHLLIEQNPIRIRCIDVGGMTRKGRSIKEYTEFYDRAYWQLGSRKAEPSYDLFALVMIVLAIYYPQPFKRQQNPLKQLSSKIDTWNELSPIRSILLAALQGKYDTADQMKSDLIHVSLKRQVKRNDRHKFSASNDVKQSIIIGCFASLFYVLSYIL